MFSLKDQTALITGGGTGIGFGIAESFIDAGARVILVGRREEVLKQAVEKLGENALYRVHDITRLDDNPPLIDDLEKNDGPLDILVNNAGIHLKKKVVETSDEEFHKVLQTHVYGAFSLSRAVARHMLQRERGSILYISSMSAIIGIPLVVAYAAAKSAYSGLVRTMSAEFAPRGVRVNCIAPGWIDTPMLRGALDRDFERMQRILHRTPLGKFGDIHDIGNAALYLCSPAAKFVSGAILPVDGGASIGF